MEVIIFYISSVVCVLKVNIYIHGIVFSASGHESLSYFYLLLVSTN